MELTFTPPAPTRAFSHEQVARYFFVRLLDDNDESTGQWRCKICTRSYRQDDGRGYNNLIAHLRARHPDFEERIRSASVSEMGSLRLGLMGRRRGPAAHVL
ncbi:hypothetical protein PC129_g19772 [Phytophthora cactorum]|nr:hypothetical protein Pcac1_g5453 [Phytophthora cactorum]KAG2835267.1 hypothetical protein PC112_g5741 [Phytophthora cactorum]KAG3018348.1 hypothetical protein PC119_g10697 [Phytophthora cactorum]KAG3028453.1 hypothetical protein PC120_g4839 [Phytophthora cactorum]KAG3131944.1 hypothetical protein C6341_g23125 [Phytophthora cactorum]